jgi:hypothetical protein
MQNLPYEVLVLIAQRIHQGRDILDWLKASEKCTYEDFIKPVIIADLSYASLEFITGDRLSNQFKD